MKKIGGAAEAKQSASLMRLINHWADIIGHEMAPKTQPVKIGFNKQKNRETGEQETIRTLQLKAEGSLGTVIAMRETIILERINRLFGTDNFKKLNIIHGKISKPQPTKATNTAVKYDLDLSDIDDPILKQRLESLGQAVMNSVQNEKG